MMSIFGSSPDQESQEMQGLQSEQLIRIPVMFAFLVFLLFFRQQQDALIGEVEQRGQLNDFARQRERYIDFFEPGRMQDGARNDPMTPEMFRAFGERRDHQEW
jgi:hypothetical protein